MVERTYTLCHECKWWNRIPNTQYGKCSHPKRQNTINIRGDATKTIENDYCTLGEKKKCGS